MSVLTALTVIKEANELLLAQENQPPSLQAGSPKHIVRSANIGPRAQKSTQLKRIVVIADLIAVHLLLLLSQALLPPSLCCRCHWPHSPIS
jgi:hypothetical protein